MPIDTIAKLVKRDLETRRCEFKSRSRELVFPCSLQCQINMNLILIYLFNEVQSLDANYLINPLYYTPNTVRTSGPRNAYELYAEVLAKRALWYQTHLQSDQCFQ